MNNHDNIRVLISYDESNELVKNNQDNNFNGNKLTIIDSITVNRKPSSDNELRKKYILMMNYIKIL